MKTDAYRFTEIRAAYFPKAGEPGVEFTDITSAKPPYVLTAEEAIALGHKLVEAGVKALKMIEKDGAL